MSQKICLCGHYPHEPGKCGAKVMLGEGAHPVSCPCKDACPSCGHPAHFPDICSIRAKLDGTKVVGFTCDCRHSASLKPLEKAPEQTAEKAQKDSAVEHPKHYNAHPAGVECITIIQEFPFNVGTAIKHLWRAGLKGGEAKKLEDLQKARQYIDFEIERIQGK